MEEKFISIDYKTWREKYVPMEKENERLKKELADKDVTFYVSVQKPLEFRIAGINDYRCNIGYLELETFHKSKDYEIIMNQTADYLKYSQCRGFEPMYSGQRPDINILTKKQAKHYLEKIKLEVEKHSELLLKIQEDKEKSGTEWIKVQAEKKI